ncbi:MAG: DUF885 domain-containing protein, partial [Planctomycetales bacterium]|nr:DUF885 domain-containing protein [Planctomycetales bacterium]
MHRLFAAGYFFALVALLPCAPPAMAADPAAEFDQLLKDHWDFVLRENPVFATRTGDHRFDDQLGKVSLADEARRNEATQGFLSRLDAIDSARLPAAQRLSHAVMRRELSDALQEHRFRTYLTPINNRTGFHIEFPELPNEVSLLRTRDFDNYVARLGGFGELVEGNIELRREGLREGVTMPAVIMEGWQDSVTSHIVKDPEESLLYKPLVKFPQAVPESEHERLRAAARKAIKEVVAPGYQKLEQFMAQEYVPHCRTSVGASGLPDGRDFYRFRVKHYTTLNMTPEEVHQRGLAEVARIRKEMQEIVEKVEFDGDLAAFMEHLRTDKSFYAKTPEELLQKCSHILKSADGQLPKLFGRLPRMPYGLREIPAFIAPKTTSAYYMSPSGDGTIAGFFYLNTYNLPSRPLFALESLALHEAVPGHHLQIALQQEMEDLHPVRRYADFTAFIEGWALYAER